MPNQPKGTIKGHRITSKQQKLFGTALGLQQSGKSSNSSAGKIAKSIDPDDLKKIASKPKSGYRKKKK